jgi:hypothetical protein
MWKCTINCGLHPNLSLHCEIGAHIKNLIINWNASSVCNSVGTKVF